MLAILHQLMMNTVRANIGYLAPELFQSPIDAPREPLTPGREVNTSKIDVFSFGLTITTMLTGKNPFEGETAAATYRNNAELKTELFL